MSKDLNKCCFIGRLGGDVVLRYLPNSTACANLNLAVGDDYKDKSTGNKIEQTEWVRISVFGKPAEVLSEYCHTGSRIYIEGKLKTRSYEKDGVKHFVTEVIASDFQMLDSKDKDRLTPQPVHRSTPQPVVPDFDLDIPF